MIIISSSPPAPPSSITLHSDQIESRQLLTNNSSNVGPLRSLRPLPLTPSASDRTQSVSTSDAIFSVETIYQKHPELHYLADPNAHVTSEGAALSAKNEQLLPSQRLFGHSYPEFDRSIQSLRCLDWIIRGNYDAYEQFIGSQDEPKLSRESFRLLHDLYQKLETVYSERGWESGVLRNTLEVALVMGDFGKSTVLREELRPYGMTAVDHDDFHAQLMQSASALELKAFASFQKLPNPAQELLKNTADLAHFGHITHLEGGARMFAGIEKSKLLKSEPEAFDFAWLVHLCDVAGALGHKFTQGSKVLNQATFENMQLTYEACKLSKELGQNGQTAIKYIVDTRSRWLGINDDDPDREVLARLSAMLRVPFSDAEKGKQLVKAYKSLPPELRDQAHQELNIASADSLPLTPTYVPAMLVNAANYAEKTGKDWQSALETTLPLLCKALFLYRQGIKDGSISKNIRLEFNHLAGLISKGEKLDVNQLSVNPESGQAYIQDKAPKKKALLWRLLSLGH